MGILLLNFIITAALYCGPILFLRFVVFQKKINKNRALLYVLISTIIVFIGIQVFTDYMYGTTSSNGAPAGFWGLVGYFILADTKKKKDTEDIPSKVKPSITPPPAQLPEKNPETFTRDIPTEAKQQKVAPVVQLPVKKDPHLSSDKKFNILLAYSIAITVLAIVFLGLSIKFYNDSLDGIDYYGINGKIYKIKGYYTTTGELIPYN